MSSEETMITEARNSAPSPGDNTALGLWRMVKSVTRLGAGEAVARLASFVLFAYITRVYGVALLGVVALAQTVASYVMMGTDQGLCLIGARIVARTPSESVGLLRPLVARRLTLCAFAVSLGTAYALWGPIPELARFYVLGFVIAVIPYAFSLDWVAWGLNHMGWLGGWRAFVSLVFVSGAVLAMHWTGTTLLPIVISRIASAVLGALLLWALWRFGWRHHVSEASRGANRSAQIELSWGAVLPLGAARFLNLCFNSVDTLILAGMTTTAEVGRYNAAYKVLFLIFAGYYLITQSVYPHFSAARSAGDLRKWVLRALPMVAVAGIALSVVIWLFAGEILTLIYGSTLGSVQLLNTLLIALPMDFCTSLVAILLISRGRDRVLLAATSLAAALNVGLNFLLIPKMQAQGAAWATVFSYGFLLIVSVALVSRRNMLETGDGRLPASAA